MAFLRLNGVTIPVSAKRGSSRIQERSARTRSHAGDYRTNVITESMSSPPHLSPKWKLWPLRGLSMAMETF